MSRNLEAVARHECGHIVVAAKLGLPLKTIGVHIDGKGEGIAFYWLTSPGNPCSNAEREKTILATYAGPIAQLKFPQQSIPDDSDDETQTTRLLEEIYPNNRPLLHQKQQELRQRAQALVEENSPAITALVTELLKKKWTTNQKHVWGSPHMQKWISGDEIARIFQRFGIQAEVKLGPRY